MFSVISVFLCDYGSEPELLGSGRSGSWRQRKSYSSGGLMRNPTRILPTCRNSDSTRLARYVHTYSSALVWDFDLVSSFYCFVALVQAVFFFSYSSFHFFFLALLIGKYYRDPISCVWYSWNSAAFAFVHWSWIWIVRVFFCICEIYLCELAYVWFIVILYVRIYIFSLGRRKKFWPADSCS